MDLDQKTAMYLANYSYNSYGRSEDFGVSKLVLDNVRESGWVSYEEAYRGNTVENLPVLDDGFNSQVGGDGDISNAANKIQNAFSILINKDTQQFVFSFKGSDAWSNWGSDFANSGATEFAKISAKAQDALTKLQESYPDFQFSSTGHSLGGGMAQAFALRNGLDARVYNSQPLAQGIM